MWKQTVRAMLCVFCACACLCWPGCRRLERSKPSEPSQTKDADAAQAEGAPRPLEALLADLGHDDPAVAASAVQALVANAKSDPAVATALIEVLRGDDAMRATDAADALVRLKDPSVLPGIIEALRLGEHRREAARTALLAIVTPQSLPALTPLLGDEQAYVRAAAVDAIASLGGDAAIDALTTGLGHDDYRTRRHIAAVLGDTGSTRVVPALVTLLSDPSPRVTDEAARALRRLSGKDLGFRPFDPPTNRRAAIEAWKKWAEE